MTSLWIGPDATYVVGRVGFLVESKNENSGELLRELRDTPAHTNASNKPRLWGWCGSTNNVSVTACGMVRVERVAKNCRAYVRELDVMEYFNALEELGYPALALPLALELRNQLNTPDKAP